MPRSYRRRHPRLLSTTVTPGDPADNILGDEASPAAKAEFRSQLQLDKPLHIQYGLLWTQISDGSLGETYELGERRPVAEAIATVLPATIELALAAMLVACLLAIPFGVLAALHHELLVKPLLTALLGVAIPIFWSGPVALFLFAVKWQVLPAPGAPLTGPLRFCCALIWHRPFSKA